MKPSNTTRPHLIITVGIPGSGKSFFAEHFAETFKAPIVSFERLNNSDTSKFSDETLSAFSKYMLSEIFKTGQTAVYDGPTGTRTQRAELAKFAKQAGYDHLLVWVQTDESTARKRAMKSDDSHKMALNTHEFEHETSRFSAPHPSERAIVISGKHNYASQLKIVLRNLATVANETATTSRIVQPRRTVVLR